MILVWSGFGFATAFIGIAFASLGAGALLVVAVVSLFVKSPAPSATQSPDGGAATQG